MYFYRYYFHIILLTSIISTIETFTIQNTDNDVNQVTKQTFLWKKSIEFFLFKVYRRQVQTTPTKRKNSQRKEKFHTADKDQLPSTRTGTYILTMLPVAKGGHEFNGAGEQEWEVPKFTDIKFAVYGM
jgi:hypothetical protein